MKKIVRRISLGILCLLLINSMNVFADSFADFSMHNGKALLRLREKFQIAAEEYRVLLFAESEFQDQNVWICVYDNQYDAAELTEKYKEGNGDIYIEGAPSVEDAALKLFEESNEEWDDCFGLLKSRMGGSKTAYKVTISEKKIEGESGDSLKDQKFYILMEQDECILPLDLAKELYGFVVDIEENMITIHCADGLFSKSPVLFVSWGQEVRGLTLEKSGIETRMVIEGTSEEIDTEAETETQREAETETETETETQRETETETETETQRGTEAETETEAQRETEAETETEAQRETEAETETEAQRETEAETETETKTEIDIQTGARTAAGIREETEIQSLTESETQSATEPETKKAAESETQSVTEPETKKAAQTETQSAAESETQSATESETKKAAESETKKATAPETQSAAESETQSAAQTETQVVTEAEAQVKTGIWWGWFGLLIVAAAFVLWWSAHRWKSMKDCEKIKDSVKDDEDTVNPESFSGAQEKRIAIQGAVINNKGRVRGNNEDNFYFNGIYMHRGEIDKGALMTDNSHADVQLYAVCDGMGGADSGEEASYRAVKELAIRKREHQKMMDTRELTAILRTISEKIYEEAKQRGQKSGTTIVMMLVSGGRVVFANVGDSRIYRFRDQKLTQISVDHSKVQRMISMGILTPEQAKTDPNRHVITQYLGMPSDIKVSPYIVSDARLYKDDIYILCSDGLSDMVEESQIEMILKEKEKPLETVQELFKAAMNNGGRDNATIMLLHIK